MREKIEPALTPEEWADKDTAGAELGYVDFDFGIVDVTLGQYGRKQSDDAFLLMALCNNALPDGDLRKLTWEVVDLLRGILAHFPHTIVAEYLAGEAAWLSALADIIEALLPPREQP